MAPLGPHTAPQAEAFRGAKESLFTAKCFCAGPWGQVSLLQPVKSSFSFCSSPCASLCGREPFYFSVRGLDALILRCKS